MQVEEQSFVVNDQGVSELTTFATACNILLTVLHKV